MASKEIEVLTFLAEFKTLIGQGKFYMIGSRQKNYNTLIQLDITESQRLSCILSLKKEDFSEGPLPDHGGNADIWIFGITIKTNEIYIKLTISKHNGKKAICISFHIAEHPLVYPFKV